MSLSGMATSSGNGRKRPTIRHVAAEAGVSIATVSGVLTNRPDCRASPKTREKVAQAARKLGYRPSLMAHALHGKKTMTLGLITGMSAVLEVWSRAITSFEETARAKGYMVLSSYTQNEPALEDTIIDEMLYRQVDALAVYPTTLGQHDRLRQIVEQGIPVVTFDTPPALALGTDDVSIDQYHGGKLQAEHLVAGGCRKVCHVNLAQTVWVNHQKTRGLEDGLAAHGLKLHSRMNLKHDHQLWAEINPDVYRQIRQYLADHRGQIDALACHGDILALLCMRAARSLNIRVPEELAIVGFNDIMVADMISPGLSTIHDPAEELGSRAATVLIERLAGTDSVEQLPHRDEPLRVKITPELVIRGSTRPVAGQG